MKKLLAVALGIFFSISTNAQTVTLHGAVQFADDHAFNKALLKFEELTKKYYGKPVNFVLHRNSELGLEKDYFAYMNQGKAVDYGIVSPAHMSTFAKAAPFIDAPFIFRDIAHWNKVLDADLLKPVADEVAAKAEVMLIGYAGGGTRNIFAQRLAGHGHDVEMQMLLDAAHQAGQTTGVEEVLHQIFVAARAYIGDHRYLAAGGLEIIEPDVLAGAAGLRD